MSDAKETWHKPTVILAALSLLVSLGLSVFATIQSSKSTEATLSHEDSLQTQALQADLDKTLLQLGEERTAREEARLAAIYRQFLTSSLHAANFWVSGFPTCAGDDSTHRFSEGFERALAKANELDRIFSGFRLRARMVDSYLNSRLAGETVTQAMSPEVATFFELEVTVQDEHVLSAAQRVHDAVRGFVRGCLTHDKPPPGFKLNKQRNLFTRSTRAFIRAVAPSTSDE